MLMSFVHDAAHRVPMLNVRVLKFFFSCCLLQIRQEKPYYIADPEVDSLVSWFSSRFFLLLHSIFF